MNRDMVRVLVVDDNRINIKAIAEALKDQCKIMAATNYELAMSAVHCDTPPDLILLDIMLPDVDGFEICRRLKLHPRSKDIPVIFITAMDGDADEARGLSMGAVDYITKPIIPAIVQARVRTQIDLRRHMEALQSAYATIQEQKSRMEQELKVGQKLQMSLQPQLPSGDGYEIAASMNSAHEVSGDFYDAFYVDPHHLCVVVGDVSGKGVPAALFMSMSRTLVRSKADNVLSTARMVTEVNRAMVGSNDACMFVTMVVAVLDTRNGYLTYTNAGHTPPLVIDDSGRVTKMPGRHGMAVGVEDTVYSEDRLKLNAAQIALFYTDGITEARDPDEQLFGESRLVRWLAEQGGQTPLRLIEEVSREVERFEAGAAQADDITLLSLRFHGMPGKVNQSSWEVSFGNDDLTHRHLSEHLGDFLSSTDVPHELYEAVYLVLEELVTNVVAYGYPGDASGLDVGIRLELDKDLVIIHISDDGIAFNPLEAPLPDTAAPLPERRTGGLGIHLCRQLVDEMHYERRNLRNNLRLVKRISNLGGLSSRPVSSETTRPDH